MIETYGTLGLLVLNVSLFVIFTLVLWVLVSKVRKLFLKLSSDSLDIRRSLEAVHRTYADLYRLRLERQLTETINEKSLADREQTMREEVPFERTEFHRLAGLITDTARLSLYSSRVRADENPYAFTTIRVFFATDRNRRSIRNIKAKFGGRRSRLRYGNCLVSIPGKHETGHLESPSIWRFEFREVPWNHVVLLEAKIYKKEDFFYDLALRVQSSRKKHAFVFIHGFNVSFEDAARRTAQMAADLDFDGAPVFYSWPSRGAVKAYTIDEQSIQWAENNVKHFLEEFIVRSNAENVYLVAHSMGNRALVGALTSLMVEKPALKNRITEIILTAPDIDAEVFKRDVVPEFAKAGRPVTLYASSDDVALNISKTFHGYARAGDCGDGLVVASGIETIDASGVDTSLLGHSHMNTRTVLSDISYLMKQGLRAGERFGLGFIDIPLGRYWFFKK